MRFGGQQHHMTLQNVHPGTLQNVHPGGFFWRVARSDREVHLLRFVAEAGNVAVITNTAREAHDFAERLTLSGVPVLVATNPANQGAVRSFVDDGLSTFVATQEYLLANGPAPASMVVHLRTCPSVRDYARRLDAAPSSVHLTFVVPEDERRAMSLLSHIGDDAANGTSDQVGIDHVIDLTSTHDLAMMAHARRRFPLHR
jgi:hypothetical protein